MEHARILPKYFCGVGAISCHGFLLEHSLWRWVSGSCITSRLPISWTLLYIGLSCGVLAGFRFGCF